MLCAVFYLSGLLAHSHIDVTALSITQPLMVVTTPWDLMAQGPAAAAAATGRQLVTREDAATTQGPVTRRSLILLPVSLLCGVAATLCKETGITVYAVYILHDALPILLGNR